jgi:hypothetical protein
MVSSKELTVLNHGNEPVQPEIVIAVAADFADLFQVKDATMDRPGKTFGRIDEDVLVLGYERGGYIRETWIRPHDVDAELDEERIGFRPTIGPQESWRTWIEIVTAVDGTPAGHERTRYRPGDKPRPQASSGRPGVHAELSELLALAPELETDWVPLKLIYEAGCSPHRRSEQPLRGSGACTERLAEELDRLGDRRLGGVCSAQRIEHDEVVDDALVADRGHGDAGLAELVRVGLALVAEDVGLTVDHECRRQPGELVEARA